MTIRAQIAFDLSLTTGVNFFTLDDTDKGVLDNTEYVLGGDALIDVTEYLRSVQVDRGRSRTLEKFTAGQCNIELDNRNRYFDPTYGPTIGGTRTNLVTNPSFEVDTAGWSATGAVGSIARDTAAALYGSASVKWTYPSNTAAGNGPAFAPTGRIQVFPSTTYTLSAYVNHNGDGDGAKSVLVGVRQYAASSGGSNLGSLNGSTASTTSSSGWTRVSATFLTGASTNYVDLRLQCAATFTLTGTLSWDGILLEQASTVGAYFDGTTADPSISVNSLTWNGTANASTSTLVWNSDPGSPYFGQILPRKQLVIDEDGEELFSGFVEDWNYSYPAGGFDAVAEVSASDGFTILARQTMTAGTQVAELSGPRVTAVLDAAGWSSVKRDIGPGQSTLDADVVAATTNVLSYLQLVETSEFGALFIGRQGALTFRDRSELQAFTTGVTFGPTGIPYTGISVVWGTEEMKNTVSVTFTAGGTVAGTALTEDTASQAAYGVIDQTITTILSSSVEASALSSWLVGLYSQPQYRVDTLTMSLDGITPVQKASVLDLELGDVVTVGFTPSSIGSAISQIVSIDKISHQARPDRHDVTFTLSETLAAFILDDAVFGVLDDDILGF